MLISQEELPSYSFSDRDAIFVTDAVQVEFLISAGNASLCRSWLFPLSTQAYAALLKLDRLRVRSYFEFVDFAECKHWYRETALQYSRTWLRELGLEFQFEGIDIATLDAPCQFLLFIHAIYIKSTAERLIRANPEVKTFYTVVCENSLPLNFYFDSDVSAAILRFVCEHLGRTVRTIVMKQRLRYICPAVEHLRFMDGRADRKSFRGRKIKIPRSSRPRVGFAAATVANYHQLLHAIQSLDCQMVEFPSIWPTARAFDRGSHEVNEYVYDLSPADGLWSPAVAARLGELRGQFLERRRLSKLPECLIRNPYLDFQFVYIFTRRWLSYANMIRRAVEFIADAPLDLLILSDHFTAEGAILARLCRRNGARVVVTLHSGWPVDSNWATWEPSDSAIVPSKSSADRIRALSGMSDVFVTGLANAQTYRSLIALASLTKKTIRAGEQRKIVLLVTNVPELHCFPCTALDAHFETIASVGRVPEYLRDRVLVAVRTKPGPIGDDPILYKRLCALSEENFTLLDGLDFSQSVEVADCVVGINIPTSGYFEVLRKGIPLIYVQTADVTALHPDLPPEVTQRVTDLGEIWPTIEAVLFDEERRRKVLEVQRLFVNDDFEAKVSGSGDPFENSIRQLLFSRHQPTLATVLVAFRHRIARRLRRVSRPAPLRESGLACHEQGGAGHIDDVLLGSDGSVAIAGWAADRMRMRPARAVHVFLHGVPLGDWRVNRSRPDVAAALNDDHFEMSGFWVHLPLQGEEDASALSIYSELHDGTFFELRNPISTSNAS